MAAGLLAEQGRIEEAERLRRFGLNPDASIASPWPWLGRGHGSGGFVPPPAGRGGVHWDGN